MRMTTGNDLRRWLVTGGATVLLAACGGALDDTDVEPQAAEAEEPSEASLAEMTPTDTASAVARPEIWPNLDPIPLDAEIEARVDSLLGQMTLEQKVGQVIQADNNSVTPEEVKTYRLGSVLSGGNSAPGDEPYADAETWLKAADAYWEASMDPEGVEVAIPVIWGIDAVHGHANLLGATVFPHNVGLGAMGDPDLIEEIAQVTARELAVSGHDWTFAPTVAVPQDDRWGRTYEGYSEDPDIVASYAGRIVTGLQGEVGTDGFMTEGRMISSAKHFLGDGGTVDGVDQGDVTVSEGVLRDVHAAGYTTAIPAGVQTVMASYNSWNGVKMHGNESLLTDVLKGQMSFQGFIVGDWNGHGQIAGCTNTDCPQAINAGLDMYMAPDSWKGLWETTLAHVQDGTISEERLDDAVRRILRVKVASGIFEKPTPSERPLAGETDILTSENHREVARRAVRQSLVLLKNEEGLLPLEPEQTVLVVGDGADSISKAAGGWTLSWQGGGYDNDMFPGGQSIYAGIKAAVDAAGGTVVFDPEGTTDTEADVVIAVYGEDPYAEFQGDRQNVDFEPAGFDTVRLKTFKERGLPVVSVFLSGRPLWTNPEMNNSDAFVAAWLPGSQGEGVADLLFQTDPSFDFTGRLSFSWPRTASQATVNVSNESDYDPLFEVGYGLTYDDGKTVGELSEDSGIDSAASGPSGIFFAEGSAVEPFGIGIFAGNTTEIVTRRPVTVGGISLSGIDHEAQEDALLAEWQDDGALRLVTSDGSPSLVRERNGDMDLVFAAVATTGEPVRLSVGIDCPRDAACSETVSLTVSTEEWTEQRISLACFSDAVDMEDIAVAVSFAATAPASVGIGHVRLEADEDSARTCGD